VASAAVTVKFYYSARDRAKAKVMPVEMAFCSFFCLFHDKYEKILDSDQRLFSLFFIACGARLKIAALQ
jgi:hypothetical protein